MDRRRLIAFAALGLLALTPAAAWAGEEGGEKKKKKTGGATYLPIDPVTATLVRGDGRRGVLTVETGLDVPDNALRTRAEQLLPRIRAAYVQVVNIYGAGLSPGTPPNAEYLSRELQRQTDIALGRPGAHLLLGTILAN